MDFSPESVEAFCRAFFVAALWSSNDNADESGGEPLDSNYGIDDIHPACQTALEIECREFIEANAADLEALNAESAGHDFWLTRCGHGAGFWDRGLGAAGRRLTDAAHVYGNVDLYVGDDGRIYASGHEPSTTTTDQE